MLLFPVWYVCLTFASPTTDSSCFSLPLLFLLISLCLAHSPSRSSRSSFVFTSALPLPLFFVFFFWEKTNLNDISSDASQWLFHFIYAYFYFLTLGMYFLFCSINPLCNTLLVSSDWSWVLTSGAGASVLAASLLVLPSCFWLLADWSPLVGFWLCHLPSFLILLLCSSDSALFTVSASRFLYEGQRHVWARAASESILKMKEESLRSAASFTLQLMQLRRHCSSSSVCPKCPSLLIRPGWCSAASLWTVRQSPHLHFNLRGLILK